MANIKFLSMIIFVCCYFFLFSCFAQDGSVVPSIADQIMAWADKIPSEGVLIVVLGAVIEFLLRFAKTSKPRSILYMISGVLNSIAYFLQKLASLLDKVLQNVKSEK